MTVTLLFLAAVLGVGARWLARADLGAKPWLETGAVPVARAPRGTGAVGLAVFLAVVGALFALLVSASVMRMENSDWRAVDPPAALWAAGAFLGLASAAMALAARAAREGDRAGARSDLALAGAATLGFLLAQGAAWRDLLAGGGGPASNPANGFFFLLTAAHGLHVLGGLVAMARAARASGRGGASASRSIALCAAYWHALLGIWVVAVAVVLGGAQDVIALCLAAAGRG